MRRSVDSLLGFLEKMEREFRPTVTPVSGTGSSTVPPDGSGAVLPPYVEQGFRWIRQTISLIYAHHRHPLPMVALIFMYAETLGKPLAGHAANTETKVCAFVQGYLPELWSALESNPDRRIILGDYYRNGLVHEMFMKKDAGIHEDKSGHLSYVSYEFPGVPCSINIDRLVPEFLNALGCYYKELSSDREFGERFLSELPKGSLTRRRS